MTDEQTAASKLYKGRIEKQAEAIKVLTEALGFYENTKRLMLDVRDLPKRDSFGMPLIYTDESIMDNGDTARMALTKAREILGE
jgi:hypothetical protein